MCNKNNPPLTPPDTRAKKNKIMKRKKIRKQTKDFSSSSTNSSTTSSLRRNRTKTRKPKYLSLRLQLSQNTDKKSLQKKTKMTPQQQPHLNLFPLHPENTVVDDDEDKDDIIMHEENNVALLFSSDGGATLTGLLEDESTTTATTTATASEEASFSTPAVDGGCDGDGGSWLVRKAMRRRELGEGMSEEERWVCYSEVTSGSGGTASYGSLSLKLDHEGILNAWSDKRSLYVAGETPQTVPDLHSDVLLYNALPPNIACDGWGSDAIGNTWTVPEICGANKMKMKEEMGWKLGQREASVLRYKEKRQNRLFSKRIRYEVRKLNAEKRPRMKGRFVKRE